MIDKDDFDIWLAHPVTLHVFDLLTRKAAEAKRAWEIASWEQGSADPLLLADLRARAELLTDITELEHEDIEDEPERDNTDRVSDTNQGH